MPARLVAAVPHLLFKVFPLIILNIKFGFNSQIEQAFPNALKVQECDAETVPQSFLAGTIIFVTIQTYCSLLELG